MTSHDVPLPPSVRIDLAGVSAAIESALGPRGIDTLSHRLSQLQARGADAALMTEVVRKLSTIAPRLVGPGGLDAWLTAVCEVDQSAPHCTGALLQSSEEVLRHGSPLEFLMWARLGLRRGQQVLHSRSTMTNWLISSFVPGNPQRSSRATKRPSIS